MANFGQFKGVNVERSKSPSPRKIIPWFLLLDAITTLEGLYLESGLKKY